MVTDVAVVIAYRDMGCPHRARSFRHVTDWYRDEVGWPVVVEHGSSDGTFTRASAINAAIRGSDAHVIVQSDPDSLVPAGRLREAVGMAADADGLVIPHDRYLYLTEAAAAGVYDGRALFSYGAEDCETFGPNGSGNVTVFSRATWKQAGGYDERFGLWGGDDGAFAVASAALVGPTRRLAGDMVHLWHPRLPQSIPGNPGYAEQFAIVAEYRDASALGADAVRELVRSR